MSKEERVIIENQILMMEILRDLTSTYESDKVRIRKRIAASKEVLNPAIKDIR
jgi:hypothetical protein